MATTVVKGTTREGRSRPHLVVVTDDPNARYIVTPDGEVHEAQDTGPSNGRRHTFRFFEQGGVEVLQGGFAFSDPAGNPIGERLSLDQEYEGGNLGSLQSRTIKPGNPFAGGGTAAGAGGFGGFGFGVPGVAPPILLDPSFVQPFPISASPINFNPIQGAQAEFIDPLETAQETAQFNLQQDEQNFATGMERARALQKAELASIQEFANAISGTQQEIVADENTFNQQQRLQAADVAIPGIQNIFADQRERAETLASGRMLSTAEDRALELTARSASADGSFVRGFGDDSVVGRRQSDILSAQQRLNISQMGENLLTRSIQQAQGLLFDTPLKANISQRLPSQPNVPLSQLATNQQGQLNQMTSISPTAVLQSRTQQEQFNTNLNQRTQEFNTQGTFQADQFNSNQDFAAQNFNSQQAYQARLAQLGVMASNALAVQQFQQGVFNVAAAGEQQQIQQEINADQQARLDEVIADFRRTRDRNQLEQGIASILGLAVGSKPVRDIVGGIIGDVINSGAEILGFEPPFEREDDTDTDIDTDTDTGGGFDDGGIIDIDDDRVTTAPDEIPEGNIGIQSNEDGTVDSIPEEDYFDEPADDLMSEDGSFLRSANFRIQPYSEGSYAFDSGADLTLSPEVRRELGPML